MTPQIPPKNLLKCPLLFSREIFWPKSNPVLCLYTPPTPVQPERNANLCNTRHSNDNNIHWLSNIETTWYWWKLHIYETKISTGWLVPKRFDPIACWHEFPHFCSFCWMDWHKKWDRPKCIHASQSIKYLDFACRQPNFTIRLSILKYQPFLSHEILRDLES